MPDIVWTSSPAVWPVLEWTSSTIDAIKTRRYTRTVIPQQLFWGYPKSPDRLLLRASRQMFKVLADPMSLSPRTGENLISKVVVLEASSVQQQTVYVKAVALRELADVAKLQSEVRLGNILIVRIAPLAKKSIEDTKKAINQLCDCVKEIGGDIARLGEERIVITPSTIRIWRSEHPLPEKSTKSVLKHRGEKS
jgi:SepF-like predicted cell division protein (DUF552 family)